MNTGKLHGIDRYHLPPRVMSMPDGALTPDQWHLFMAGAGEPVRIPAISGGEIQGYMYPVLGARPGEGARSAVILVPGAGNSTTGPSNMYDELACDLQEGKVAALRLRCRQMGDSQACVEDVISAIEHLRRQGIERFALIGWSFGGAVVLNAGMHPNVTGVATINTVPTGDSVMRRLQGKDVLLLTGTEDPLARASQDLYRAARPPKMLVGVVGDDHQLTNHDLQAIQRLATWSQGLLAETEPRGQAEERPSKTEQVHDDIFVYSSGARPRSWRELINGERGRSPSPERAPAVGRARSPARSPSPERGSAAEPTTHQP